MLEIRCEERKCAIELDFDDGECGLYGFHDGPESLLALAQRGGRHQVDGATRRGEHEECQQAPDDVVASLASSDESKGTSVSLPSSSSSDGAQP